LSQWYNVNGNVEKIVVVNADINLAKNIWKKYGLVNGASGTIKHIKNPKTTTDKCLPYTIIIHFSDYDGPQFFNEVERKNWIPLNAAFCYQNKCTRKRYAMRLGYASTVHKIQIVSTPQYLGLIIIVLRMASRKTESKRLKKAI